MKLVTTTDRLRRAAAGMLLVAGTACGAAPPAAAGDGHSGHGAGPGRPYAGHEQRPIKGLAPGQVEDLLAGRGAGQALSAELNGYPGPLHVLELADALALSDGQRGRARMLQAQMLNEAKALGRRVVELEAELDRLFASGDAAPAAVHDLLQQLGRSQAELRFVHLKHHLLLRPLLSDAQVRRYGELRGYAPAGR